MIVNLYSIRDDKIGYGLPIGLQNDEMALRMFISTVRQEQPNPCNKFPEDITFCRVGQFDDQTGTFIPLEKPVILGYAASFVQAKKPSNKKSKKVVKNENDV